MNIGKNIEFYRKRKGLSQQQLASILKVKTQTVMYWEMDVEEPDPFELLDLASALGITNDQLIGATKQSIDSSISNPIDGLLGKDEVLLWQGKPGEKMNLQAMDIFPSIFGVFFGGFALFWIITAAMLGGFFALFGLPFLGIGIYMTFGRFIHQKHVRKTTFYGVTNHRILVVSGSQGSKIHEIRYRSITSMNIKKHTNGLGSIYFLTNQYVGMTNRYHNPAMHQQPLTLGFNQNALLDITNVDEVYRLIQDHLPKN